MENLVGYAKTDLMIPLGVLEGTVSLEAANAGAAAWCEEVNGCRHSEIAAVPTERLTEVEGPLLAPLPSLRPSIGRRETRKVDRLSTVRFASARYSVPQRLVGHAVVLLAGGDRLTIVEPTTGEILAEHPLLAPGESSISDEHYEKPRPVVPARALRARTEAEKRFIALGPVAEAFLRGAAAAGATRLPAELTELADLAAAHGQDVFLAALRRAVGFSRWRAEDVRSILAAGTGVTTQTPAGDALVIDLPATQTRPLSEYSLRSLTSSPGDVNDSAAVVAGGGR